MTALSFVWVHPYSQISGCDSKLKKEFINPKLLKLTHQFLTR